MKIPTFISATSHTPPNWNQAFPDFLHLTDLPNKFDLFDDSIIFLDYMNIAEDQRSLWLDTCVASKQKVLVLSPTPSEIEAIEAIKSGAVGYGHTLASKALLQQMALVVHHGGIWLGAKLMGRVMSALSGQQEQRIRKGSQLDTLSAELTERERDVARYISVGASNLEISNALVVTERTVKAHLTSLFRKLGVKNRVELALLLNKVRDSSDSMAN